MPLFARLRSVLESWRPRHHHGRTHRRRPPSRYISSIDLATNTVQVAETRGSRSLTREGSRGGTRSRSAPPTARVEGDYDWAHAPVAPPTLQCLSPSRREALLLQRVRRNVKDADLKMRLNATAHCGRGDARQLRGVCHGALAGAASGDTSPYCIVDLSTIEHEEILVAQFHRQAPKAPAHPPPTHPAPRPPLPPKRRAAAALVN
ncbi:hypothetical protein EMCLV026L [Equine molluscum contagiosum-like virus]|nr:hypothetical protein EMCLV026L [Equine molluscum contagiosum-like virus]